MTGAGSDVEKVAGFEFLLQIRGKPLAAFEQRDVLFSFSGGVHSKAEGRSRQITNTYLKKISLRHSR